MTASFGSTLRKTRRPVVRRILIADDDPSMRELLSAVFLRAGYEVVPVCDGREVIQRLRDVRQPRPDVIISDVVMPGDDGFSVLREVERMVDPPAVILITAFPDQITHRRALERGALEVIDKPFDLDALKRVVRRVLEERELSGSGSKR